MASKDNRNCPSCQFPIKGIVVTEEDLDFREFECPSCDEQWYENTKYCLAKFDAPPDLE